MQAHDVMTRAVVTAHPDTPLREIAALLLAHAIGAVPIVDEDGRPVGMVGKGDLVEHHDERAREARRDWRLTALAEGGEIGPDLLARLHRPETKAREVMSAPVVTVEEDDDIREIAQLLADYRIRSVPVLRDDRVVGIVSRADLLRAFAACGAGERPEPEKSKPAETAHDLFAWVDQHFHAERQPSAAAPAAPPAASPARPESGGEPLQAESFRHLVADFRQREAEHQSAARRAAAAERRKRAEELIDRHISGDNWRALVHQARQAAEHGAKEFLLLRFPRELLSDGGRAVNAPEPDWPQTLRGEAAEIYLRWERDLKPRGFGIAARVLDFPGGMPGDVGLFLVWGE
ncbi:MAG TPA: CBS domain-containing protein [Stellaceae bacterium]|nr:CBS domain-containing protein [Stellaceae bacterium]